MSGPKRADKKAELDKFKRAIVAHEGLIEALDVCITRLTEIYKENGIKSFAVTEIAKQAIARAKKK